MVVLLITASLNACGGGASGDSSGGGNSSSSSSGGNSSSGGGTANQAPAISSFALAPENAYTTTTLSTALDANDPDGTQLDESYAWQVNGQVIEGETEAQLDPEHFAKGDTVSVKVTVSDGADTATQNASTLILNSVPKPSAEVDSPEKTDSTVTLRGSATDADDDEISYRWEQLAGEPVELSDTSVAEPTFSSPSGAGELVFALSASDGEGQSEPADVTVKISTPPSIDNLSLSPEEAYTDTPLTASLEASDADDDELTQSYAWQVNGELLEEQTANSLGSNHYAKGDTVEVIATIFDGTWEAVHSTKVTIGNSAPEASAFAESNVKTNSTVTLHGSASDLDEDELTYKWVQVSGDPVVLSSSTVAEPTFTTSRIATDLVFTLTASDGEFESEATEVSVTVVNTAPTISSLALSELPAYTDTDLSASIEASDEDGLPLFTDYQWFVNGRQLHGVDGNRLPSNNFIKGDRVSVTVAVNDSELTSSKSAESEILNSLPQPTATAESPVKTGDTATLLGNATDADNDEISYHWEQVSGEPVVISDPSAAEATFTAPSISGELIFALRASDDEVQSEPVEVAVKVGTPPDIDSLSLSPDVAYTDTPLTASLEASDIDGDNLIQSYSWLVNGEPLEEQTANRLDSEYYKKGDTVEVAATVSDGNWESTQSVEVTIANRIPEASASAEASVKTNRGVTLHGSGTDLDNDELSYTWTQVSGEPVTLSSSSDPEPTFTTSRVSGELVFALTVNDGESTSEAVEIPVEIVNTAPTINSLAFSELPAFTNTDLNAVVEASDEDGLPPITNYQWFVNGEQIPGFDEAVLPSSNFAKGDQISVAATVTDGELTTSESVDTVIQDAPPEITVLNMPETVQYGKPVIFQVVIEDADDDPFTWEFTARPNGMEMDESGVVTWTPTGPMFDTQLDVNWELTATQGETSANSGRTITVIDEDRKQPLARSGLFLNEYVYVTPNSSRMIAGDFNSDGVSELLITDGEQRLYTVAYDGNDYSQSWMYPFTLATANGYVASMASHDIDRDGFSEFFVGTYEFENGTADSAQILVIDGKSRKLRQFVNVGGYHVESMRVEDVDQDNELELVALVNLQDYNGAQKRIEIRNATDLSLEWQSSVLPLGSELAVGNTDNDDHLEIVTSNGYVFEHTDSYYRNEWLREDGFGIYLDIADMDGDGIDEIISLSTDNHYLTVFDGIERDIKFNNNETFNNFSLHDTNGNGNPEIFTFQGCSAYLYAFDLASSPQLSTIWSISDDSGELGGEFGNSGYCGGVSAIADVDGDGELEFIWNGGSPRRLFVAGENPEIKLEWNSATSYHHRTPFKGGELATLINDGQRLVFFAEAWINSGEPVYVRAAKLDPSTGGFQWSEGIGNSSGNYFSGALTDLQSDGKIELLYASDKTPAIFEFFSNSDIWQAPEMNSDVKAVAKGRLNGDSEDDLLVTTRDGSIHAYDGLNGAPLWNHSSGGGVDVEVADLNNDGAAQVIVADANSISVLLPSTDSASLQHHLALEEIPESLTVPIASWNLEGTDIMEIAVGDIDGDSTQEVVLITSFSLFYSWVVILDSDLTPMSANAIEDEILAAAIQNYGENHRNILISVESSNDVNGGSRFIEMDAVNGSVVSQSPEILGKVQTGSMHFSDIDNDNNAEISYGTSQAMNVSR